jgi:hypothetical protein
VLLVVVPPVVLDVLVLVVCAVTLDTAIAVSSTAIIFVFFMAPALYIISRSLAAY